MNGIQWEFFLKIIFIYLEDYFIQMIKCIYHFEVALLKMHVSILQIKCIGDRVKVMFILQKLLTNN